MSLYKLDNISVLYVEDNPDLREAFSKKLQTRVKKLYCAENGLDGYEQYLLHHPDIIVSDIMMPYLDGIEMVKKIRETDKEIPIVFTTSSRDNGIINGSMDLQVQGYLSKPVKINELLELLSTMSQLLHLQDSSHDIYI